MDFGLNRAAQNSHTNQNNTHPPPYTHEVDIMNNEQCNATISANASYLPVN